VGKGAALDPIAIQEIPVMVVAGGKS
jgi:hypothetical protein